MNYIADIPRTAMEVFNMLPEGTRCEVIDNTLYMSPSLTNKHQRLLLKLAGALLNFEHLGLAYPAPFDVYFENETNVVQPDVLFVKQENLSILHENGIHGIPDLIIEILYSNKEYDTRKKFELYQRNQVPEYVIIDPVTTEIWHYVLTEGRLVRQPSVNGKLQLNVVDLIIGF